MGKLLDTLRTASETYAVETAGDGFVLVAAEAHRDEFNALVRELLNREAVEFVVLPVTDGGTGYERAIILPC
ncbi:hypothetical protein BH10PSE1_BH10PSE1_13660 [soil metagenome]